MKTAVEFSRGYFGTDWQTRDLRAIEARDAEWRRLVEEAKGERDRWKNNNVLVTAEVDRLKGELAEAQRLILDAPPLGARTAYQDWLAQRDYYFANPAATPAAEQAQGEAAPSEEVLGPFIDTTKPLYSSAPAGGILDDVNAQVAALAKRMDALEHEAQEDAQAWVDTALALTNRVTKLEAVIKRIDAEHAELCPQHTGLEPLPPKTTYRITPALGGLHGAPSNAPDAAVPGHVFLCRWNDGRQCNDWCRCTHCDVIKRDHAVPPIPEGGAR